MEEKSFASMFEIPTGVLAVYCGIHTEHTDIYINLIRTPQEIH
jgi:hypothetical protein